MVVLNTANNGEKKHIVEVEYNNQNLTVIFVFKNLLYVFLHVSITIIFKNCLIT